MSKETPYPASKAINKTMGLDFNSPSACPKLTHAMIQALIKDKNILFIGPIQCSQLKTGPWEKHELRYNKGGFIDGCLFTCNLQFAGDKTALLTAGWPGNRTAICQPLQFQDKNRALQELYKQLQTLQNSP